MQGKFSEEMMEKVMRRVAVVYGLLLVISGTAIGQDVGTLNAAWGTIKIVGAGSGLGDWGAGVSSPFLVSLVSADQTYQQTDRVRAGEFTFPNVPTGVYVYFTLEYTSPTGKKNVYRGTYRFQKPNAVASKFRHINRAAGYIGDFEVNLSTAEMRYLNRYRRA